MALEAGKRHLVCREEFLFMGVKRELENSPPWTVFRLVSSMDFFGVGQRRPYSVAHWRVFGSVDSLFRGPLSR